MSLQQSREAVMAGGDTKGGGTKVMVSNLPLLFARGSPTSLESMCLEELQLFLQFVLR